MSKKKSFRSEKALTNTVVKKLEGSSLDVFQEVPMLGRSIDLVLLKNKKTIGIEFKLSNWRKAVEQANDYLIAADIAYICMPERKVTSALKELLSVTGVGLLFPNANKDWPFDEIIKPRKSKKQWSAAANGLRLYIEQNKAS